MTKKVWKVGQIKSKINEYHARILADVFNTSNVFVVVVVVVAVCLFFGWLSLTLSIVFVVNACNKKLLFS